MSHPDGRRPADEAGLQGQTEQQSTAIVHASSVERKPIELAALPELIDAAVAEAETHAGAAVAGALRAGALLLQAKEQVPHGDWEPWLTANCRVSVRTAQAYMRLHKRVGELPEPKAQRVALLPLREAMTAISTPPKASPRSERYRPPFTVRPVFETAARTLSSVCRDVGLRPLKRERIDGLRQKLQAVLAELDRMLSEVQA